MCFPRNGWVSIQPVLNLTFVIKRTVQLQAKASPNTANKLVKVLVQCQNQTQDLQLAYRARQNTVCTKYRS